MRIHDTPPRRNRMEPLLPMIDVVFFLVVFFMIVSRLADPEPFAVSRPAADGTAQRAGEFGLFLSAAGELGFIGPQGEVLGDGALTALSLARRDHCAASDCTSVQPLLLLHADTAAPARRLAAILPQLAAAGFQNITLLTVPE